MAGRDPLGRFAPGNEYAGDGGRARAAQLSPQRRREIARAGWEGLIRRRFGGDREAAERWFGRLGAWASDAAYRDAFPVFQHPGPCPERGGNERL
jgi:hypothetical protein